MSQMSELDLVRREERCGNCGSRNRPASTVVIDWRTELMCDRCVATFDWSDWEFDPVLNAYFRRRHA
jgi:hypothetical protein